jgi:hypothetical protein
MGSKQSVELAITDINPKTAYYKVSDVHYPDESLTIYYNSDGDRNRTWKCVDDRWWNASNPFTLKWGTLGMEESTSSYVYPWFRQRCLCVLLQNQKDNETNDDQTLGIPR